MNTNLSFSLKRWIIPALIVLLLMSSTIVVVPVFAQGVPGCPIRITMYDTLLVRASASFGSRVTVQLAAGDVVCMIGRSTTASWVQLARPDQPGNPLGWAPASAFTTTVPITVLPITDSGTTTTPPSSGQTYVVQAGDSLSKIAQRFNVSLNALIQANKAQPPAYVIYVGQVLIIPGTGGPVSTPGYTQYVVKQGEYLVLIARQYNLHWRTLATVNGIQYPYTIYPGQILLIPTSG